MKPCSSTICPRYTKNRTRAIRFWVRVLLTSQSPRRDVKEMTRADVYPGVIWERDADEALEYVLDSYKKLVAFYKRAAERGQAIILAIS